MIERSAKRLIFWVDGRRRIGDKMAKMSSKPEKVVKEYVSALDSQDFDLAAGLIAEDVRIIGPAGENFGKPKDFTNMLKRYHGKYKILKMFVDGEDVGLMYDFTTSGKTVYMSSWYKVESGRINYIRTVFDPSAFE